MRRNYCLLTTGPHGHPTARTNHLHFYILVSPALGSMPLCRVATYAVRTEEFLHLRRLGQVNLNPYLGAPILSSNPRSVFSFIFFFQEKEREKKNKQNPNKEEKKKEANNYNLQVVPLSLRPSSSTSSPSLSLSLPLSVDSNFSSNLHL